ncbi:PAS domain-containing sensor histidine kinase [Pseudoxanthomonas koreensis]|uniref:PAS domain-containing sensor histidine kinase n=1 Tax=Pseudoxanthomonas koreensis TaxID=266061 RepID=UPI001390E1EC|nr:ATP-binding protein [Pseudoxanthomonas koreensis]
MNWVELVWPMLAAASFVLGLIHAVVWLSGPRDRAHMVFAVAAFAVGAIALFELASFQAQTPGAMAAVIRGWHVPITLLVCAIVYGVHTLFGHGSPALALAAVALRLLALVLNFATGVNLNFESIDAIGHVAWFGVEVAYPTGVLNPWAPVAQLSNLLVVAYLVQTLYRVPRSAPARNAALVVCGGWLLLVLTMLASTVSIILGQPRLPLGTSPSSVVMILLLGALMVRDLRHGRRMDVLLQESERRNLRTQRDLELAANAANLGLWRWDVADSRFTQNETNHVLLGHAATSGEAARDLFGNAERGAEDERAFRDAIRRPVYEFEYRIQRADGARRWILLRGNVEHDLHGEPAVVRGVTLDVTRRKDEAEVLRTLLEAAPSALLVFDEAGTVRYANVAAASTFGHTQEALAGMAGGALVTEAGGPQGQATWREFVDGARTNEMGGARDLHGQRSDGESFPIEVRLCRVVLEERPRIMLAVVDLSARKKVEYEMAMERESVAHLARVTMLGELAGSLAHELNQPLAAILSNAQAAQRILHRDPSDLEQVHEILFDIVETDRRAGQVIGRLRSMLRREAREFRPLDINDVVQDCVRLMRNDLLNRRVSCRMNLMPGLPLVAGDPIQLQQVLMNLLRNACDALPGDPANRIVRVRTYRSDTGVRVEVADTGSGIPEEMLEQIFTPFETTKTTGMGMGLAVCRTIVRAHGGRIWAENLEPRGARVSMDLPVQE